MELLVIGAVGILVMAFAMTVARWLVRQPAGEHELQRTAALVSRAVRHYLKRQTTVSVALAAVIGAVVFLCYGVAYQLEMVTVVSPREHGVWVTSAYIVGAGLALAVGWVASWTSCQANMRVAGGACRSIHESLQVGVRAGAVSGVVALAAAVLGLALLFGCALWYTGNTTAAVIRAPHLVGGYALGAAFIALLSQLGGGIFGKVADIGADVAGKLEASLPEDSPQNPAAIADLVGDNVGNSAAQAVSLYATTVTELLAAMLIAGQFYGANTHLPSAIAVVLLPLVMRAFGLLGTWFGVLVVRTDDREVPMNALSRGLHLSTLLGAVAGAGTAKWLLGPHWLPFAGCIGAGAVASLLFLYIVQYYTEQKHRPVRALAEAARGGPTLAALRGMLHRRRCIHRQLSPRRAERSPWRGGVWHRCRIEWDVGDRTVCTRHGFDGEHGRHRGRHHRDDCGE